MAESSTNYNQKAKDSISWSIAITQASLNVFCMEANSAIANRKREINRVHKHYLAGKAQMEYQFGDPSFKESIWESKKNEALLKYKKTHEHKIKKMTDNYKNKMLKLRNEISENDLKILDFKKSISESEKILKQEVRPFDYEIVKDLSLLRKAIEDENRKIEDLERIKSMENQNRYNSSSNDFFTSNLYSSSNSSFHFE